MICHFRQVEMKKSISARVRKSNPLKQNEREKKKNCTNNKIAKESNKRVKRTL